MKVPEIGACLASLMDSKEVRAELRKRVEGSEEVFREIVRTQLMVGLRGLGKDFRFYSKSH